jgi:hypothetical protein
MKLSVWAKKQGIAYRTAWEHFRTGKIPNAYKLASGTIIVPDEKQIQKTEFVEFIETNLNCSEFWIFRISLFTTIPVKTTYEILSSVEKSAVQPEMTWVEDAEIHSQV